MRRFLLLAATALIAEAQSNAFGSDNSLCNGSFADANATGVITYNPNVFQGAQEQQPDNDSGKTLPITIVKSIVKKSSTVELSTWINTNGANYSDDFGLGYDVCAFAITPLLSNTYLRSQNDNGSCHEMFDHSCVGAINTATQDYALQLTENPSPPPNSNLTWSSLPSVCNDIAGLLTANPPSECNDYFQGNTTFTTPTALTGYNYSGIYGECYTNGTGPSDPETYWFIQGQSGEGNDTAYDANAQLAGVISVVWMPIANAARPSTILNAQAAMFCSRATMINPGSRTPAAFPTAEPVGGASGLNGGAIAGIVVGVILGVAIVVGLAAWWFLKRRKAAKVEGTMEKDVDTLNTAPDDLGSAQSPATVVSELPQDWMRPELDAGKDVARFELPEQNKANELMSVGEHGRSLVELEGTIPEDEGKHRLE